MPTAENWDAPTDRAHFELNYGFVLNIIFLSFAALLVKLFVDHKTGHDHGHHHHHNHGSGKTLSDKVMLTLSAVSVAWLVIGLGLYLAG